jgi:hypothetical protein
LQKEPGDQLNKGILLIEVQQWDFNFLEILGIAKKRDFLWESEMTIKDTSWKSVEQCDFKLGDNAIDDLGMGPKMTSFGSPYLGWILFGVNPTHNWIMTLPECGYEQVTQLFTSQLLFNWNIFLEMFPFKIHEWIQSSFQIGDLAADLAPRHQWVLQRYGVGRFAPQRTVWPKSADILFKGRTVAKSNITIVNM